MESIFIEALAKELPPTFSRPVVAQYLKGILSAGTLANFDCIGQGPASVKIGRTVCYERGSFLTWLEGRMTARSRGKIGGGA